jgi:hypothetical protein
MQKRELNRFTKRKEKLKSIKKSTSIHHLITERLTNRIKRGSQQRKGESEKMLWIGVKAMELVNEAFVTLINSTHK